MTDLNRGARVVELVCGPEHGRTEKFQIPRSEILCSNTEEEYDSGSGIILLYIEQLYDLMPYIYNPRAQTG